MKIHLDRLKNALIYDPESGQFTRAVGVQASAKGRVVGSKVSGGYLSVMIGGQSYLLHRLAWFYMTGSWPVDQIDHINRNPSDNRFSNLREATGSQNQQNQLKKSNNKSGFKGVAWEKQAGKWRAQINVKGERRHLGFFTDVRVAAASYMSACDELHTHKVDSALVNPNPHRMDKSLLPPGTAQQQQSRA